MPERRKSKLEWLSERVRGGKVQAGTSRSEGARGGEVQVGYRAAKGRAAAKSKLARGLAKRRTAAKSKLEYRAAEGRAVASLSWNTVGEEAWAVEVQVGISPGIEETRGVRGTAPASVG